MLVSFMFEVIVLKICFLAKEQTMQAYYLLWKQKLWSFTFNSRAYFIKQPTGKEKIKLCKCIVVAETLNP